jgi:hypothetical protein
MFDRTHSVCVGGTAGAGWVGIDGASVSDGAGIVVATDVGLSVVVGVNALDPPPPSLKSAFVKSMRCTPARSY